MHVTTCVGRDRRSAALVVGAGGDEADEADEAEGVAFAGSGNATTRAGRVDRERGSGGRDRVAPAPADAVAVAAIIASPAIGRAHPGQTWALSETLRPQSGQSTSAISRWPESTNPDDGILRSPMRKRRCHLHHDTA